MGGPSAIGAKKLDVNFDADDFFNQMMEDPKPKAMPKPEKKEEKIEENGPSFSVSKPEPPKEEILFDKKEKVVSKDDSDDV